MRNGYQHPGPLNEWKNWDRNVERKTTKREGKKKKRNHN